MNKYKIITVVCFFFYCCSVPAAGTEPGKQIVMQGSAKGSLPCKTCHGIDGAGNEAGYPRLAGLNAVYITKQLHDFAEGRRLSATMQPIAKALIPQEVKAVASYYAQQPVTVVVTWVDAKRLELGAQLVSVGNWNKHIPACEQCHGPDNRGTGIHFPDLAGQHASYIEAQLNAWKKGTRHNDPLELMTGIASRLSKTEIKAVAAYLASLRPDGAKPVQFQKRHSGSQATSKAAPSARVTFISPHESELPDNPFSKMVLDGKDLFMNTQRLRGKYVGNGQNCVNCHLDRGRLANAAPMWAAYVHYPAYRKKNNKVNTLTERIQGCFTYSMNGRAPSANSEVMKTLQTYMFWLAKNAPVGTNMKGRGYPKLAKPAMKPDTARGEKIFISHCALCHGTNGAGTKRQGKVIFPPLWGKDAYNWGAGMHRINTAAAFIKANMPFSKPGSLSDQDAWDVAAFVNSHERPQDPRFTGSIKKTKATYHQEDCLYGAKEHGAVLGAGSFPNPLK